MITPLTLSGWEPNSRADHDQVTVPEQESSPRTQIQAAGFENIGTDHAARCLSCGLLVYEWPPNIEPFTLHAQRSPACSFVLSLRPTLINRPLTTATTADDQPSRQTKLDPLVEVHTLKVARQRTFSHWPHRSQHSAASMIEAGFFCCNVDDRVICLYCNLICQGWRDSKDDASTVHTALSPRCPYVTSTLIAPASSTASEQIANRDSAASVDEPSQDASFGDILTTQTRRAESFLRRLSSDLECSPQVNEEIQGTAEEDPGSIIRCISDDNTERKSCTFVEGVQGDNVDEEARPGGHTDDLCNKAESLLSRFVAARLDLPYSKKLLKQFSRFVIKRCWEDQLRIKRELEIRMISECSALF